MADLNADGATGSTDGLAGFERVYAERVDHTVATDSAEVEVTDRRVGAVEP